MWRGEIERTRSCWPNGLQQTHCVYRFATRETVQDKYLTIDEKGSKKYSTYCRSESRSHSFILQYIYI